MRFSKYIYATLFLLCSFTLLAQTPELLKSEGKIPKDFITPSTVKYKNQVKSLEGKKAKRRDKKNKKRFILESNFGIDDILQSGLVLFNDPASLYINKVLDNLPFSDHKLKKKKPRAYILNTPAVNAFATDQGIIFVTLGLLANLENEAQLAFILAHELIHVQHQHALNKFEQSKEIDRSIGRKQKNMGQMSVDRNVFEKSMYSRKLEEQADDEGLEIFLKSEYDPEMVLNTFKILHYAYLPFDNLVFEKPFLEDEHFKLPSKLWLNDVNPISAMNDEKDDDEKLSTHPSSAKRLKKIKEQVRNAKTGNKKAFILPESMFRDIQSKARYQIPFLNLYAENFPEAIYTAYLMLKEYPDNFELKKIVGKALYMEAKYRNYDDPGDKLIDIADEAEGEVHQVYNLMAKLSPKELTILATKYNWNLYKEAKEDNELELTTKDAFTEFAYIFEDLSDFSTSANTEEVSSDTKGTKNDSNSSDSGSDIEIEIEIETESTSDQTTAENTEEKKKTKLDNIEEQSNKNYYWKYAFVNELKGNEFRNHFAEGLEIVKERKEKDDYYDSSAGYRAYRKQLKKEEKKGKQLGIKKVVVVNPFYLSIDARKNDAIQYIRSEEKQVAFRESIEKISKISKINAKVLDVTALSSNNIETFNDISEINNYFSQQMDHYDLTLTPAYNQNATNAIAEKYGSDYFLWTGVISLREKNNKWRYTVLSLLYPIFLPLTIPGAVTPEFDMLYYAILFDVKTGRRSILKMDYFDKRDSKTILNAHIYDVFHQINSK